MHQWLDTECVKQKILSYYPDAEIEEKREKVHGIEIEECII